MLLLEDQPSHYMDTPGSHVRVALTLSSGSLWLHIHNPTSMKKTTTDHLAIYTVELMAIIAALYWIEESGTKKVIINQIKSNQITFIVTSPQHKCLGE